MTARSRGRGTVHFAEHSGPGPAADTCRSYELPSPLPLPLNVGSFEAETDVSPQHRCWKSSRRSCSSLSETMGHFENRGKPFLSKAWAILTVRCFADLHVQFDRAGWPALKARLMMTPSSAHRHAPMTSCCLVLVHSSDTTLDPRFLASSSRRTRTGMLQASSFFHLSRQQDWGQVWRAAGS